jgi:hypothetical protein
LTPEQVTRIELATQNSGNMFQTTTIMIYM